MFSRSGWLRSFLTSREGIAVICASFGGSLALGLLPDVAQAVPWIGSSLGSMAAVAVFGLLVLAVATHVLRHREGMGIVLYLPQGPQRDISRIDAMKEHARSKHATCFTVDVSHLLDGETIRDPVRFAFRLMQARLREETEGRQVPQLVSFYVTARLPDAYRLGWLLKFQLHESVDVYDSDVVGEHSTDGCASRRPVAGRLMGLSEERAKGLFTALSLDSRLKHAPAAVDLALLCDVLKRAPDQELDWRSFVAEGDAPPRIALILRVADNPTLVQEALRAAETGVGGNYRFGADTDPDRNRCGGALVIDTKTGNIPDTSEHYEALVRYVAHHWKRRLDAWSEHRDAGAQGLLFTDAPATIVLALGAVIGRHTRIVPYVPPQSGATA